ncbi:Serine/threonine-protein kinase PLK4 [Chionoecetes opilio]|uniref:Serine/threonine-protein kinase PLK4 n=1 Tax=Chionoecetes opilio TaxID=41210 RepID=A0A8J4XND2_CHIOP|nr:Serine/threonine-protein kinase PLK4 [Chionoecetes opilio]
MHPSTVIHLAATASAGATHRACHPPDGVAEAAKLTRADSTLQDFDVGEQLGKGGFATVYQARCCNTGRDVAIKKPLRGIRILRPGALHRARWMAKIIYAIKIYLFRYPDQFCLTAGEKSGI